MGLGHRLTHLPGQLSGGEQQRVALARAFAARPRLLLADEPTGNLDAATGPTVMDLLFGLQATHGTTLLLITHDPALAARCGRQVRIADGRVRSAHDRLHPGARGSCATGVRGLRIVLACLALGVAAIAAVGSLRAGIEPGWRPKGGACWAATWRSAAGAQPLPHALRDWLTARGARCRTSCRCAPCWSRRAASGSWWS